jgi:hypothetical protein
MVSDLAANPGFLLWLSTKTSCIIPLSADQPRPTSLNPEIRLVRLSCLWPLRFPPDVGIHISLSQISSIQLLSSIAWIFVVIDHARPVS